MSLRLKLLLLGLATLVLPWAGCDTRARWRGRCAKARTGSLGDGADLAASLQGRTDLLYRETPPAAPRRGDLPGRPPSAPDPEFYKPTPYDLSRLCCRRRRSSMATRRSGREAQAWTIRSRTAPPRCAILTGVHERMLYLLFEVHASTGVRCPGHRPLDPSGFGDRVWLGFEDPEGMSIRCSSARPVRGRCARAGSRARVRAAERRRSSRASGRVANR